jgi:glucuronosyltransferase
LNFNYNSLYICNNFLYLAHPNVKVFITHGGRLSTQEAVYHGVPVLAVAVFFDQHMNARRAEEMGVGVRLDFISVTKNALTSALNQLFSDNK